jgi:hypothetical protein
MSHALPRTVPAQYQRVRKNRSLLALLLAPAQNAYLLERKTLIIKWLRR